MLRKELRESDIPHRTTIRKRVEEVLSEHLDKLEHEMAVRQFGCLLEFTS
jgi:hypothetical protein